MTTGPTVPAWFMDALLELAHRHDGRHQGDAAVGTCCLSPTGAEGADDVLALLEDLLAQDRARIVEADAQRAALEQLLGGSELDIALQPVVDLTSGRCLGVEALSRFPLPLGSPDAAFAIAQAAGLRFELECLAAGLALEVLPLLAPDQSLAINLSPDVAAGAMRYAPDDLPLDQIVLEITEHAAVESYGRIRERIRPLRERGLRLAVDDAGAGFASLRHIVELRPDIIKIDRSLVADAGSDVARRSVITTFVLLALDIGSMVVAEGVETVDELEAVGALGVDAAQGYLLGRPTTDRSELRRWGRTSLLPPTGGTLAHAG